MVVVGETTSSFWGLKIETVAECAAAKEWGGEGEKVREGTEMRFWI